MYKRNIGDEKSKKSKNFIKEQKPGRVDEAVEIMDLVEQDIKTIVSLHLHTELKVSRHQRFLEMIAAYLGHPQCFYLLLLFVVLWITGNILNIPFMPLLDPAPFYWLQGIIGLNSFLMTLIVVSVQSRQGKLAERWKHLDLQVSLLMERKVSKVVALIEELRRDLPNVEDRYDPQASAMEKSIDPEAAFASLNETFEEAAKEVEQTIFHSDLNIEVATSVEVSITTEQEPPSEVGNR
jgi:uncharacterized membrane protein